MNEHMFTITGVIFVVATIGSIAGIWWDRRKLRKWEERRRQWQYLDQAVDRENEQ